MNRFKAPSTRWSGLFILFKKTEKETSAFFQVRKYEKGLFRRKVAGRRRIPKARKPVEDVAKRPKVLMRVLIFYSTQKESPVPNQMLGVCVMVRWDDFSFLLLGVSWFIWQGHCNCCVRDAMQEEFIARANFQLLSLVGPLWRMKLWTDPNIHPGFGFSAGKAKDEFIQNSYEN